MSRQRPRWPAPTSIYKPVYIHWYSIYHPNPLRKLCVTQSKIPSNSNCTVLGWLHLWIFLKVLKSLSMLKVDKWEEICLWGLKLVLQRKFGGVLMCGLGMRFVFNEVLLQVLLWRTHVWKRKWCSAQQFFWSLIGGYPGSRRRQESDEFQLDGLLENPGAVCKNFF